MRVVSSKNCHFCFFAVTTSFQTSYETNIIMSEYVVPQWLFINIEADNPEQPFCVKYCFPIGIDFALVLRHDCFKIDGDVHKLSTVCGFWRYKAYADNRPSLLLRWWQMRLRSSEMRIFSFDHCISIGLLYPNLHSFVRFPCDSMGFAQFVNVTMTASLISHNHTQAGNPMFLPII